MAWDFRQSLITDHAFIVPATSVFIVHCLVLVAMRKDQGAVQRIEVLDCVLTDSKNLLISHGGPNGGLEEHDDESKRLWIISLALVEPRHPVSRGNASVVQPWRVNEIKLFQLATLGLLRDSFYGPCCLECTFLATQSVHQCRFAVADGSYDHYSRLFWVGFPSWISLSHGVNRQLKTF